MSTMWCASARCISNWLHGIQNARTPRGYSAMEPPRVNVYLNRSTGFYHANVYWPKLRARFRPSLGVKTPEEAEIAIAEFVRVVVPTLKPNGALRHPQDAQAPKSTALSAVWDYYTKTYLPVRNASESTIGHCGSILRGFELYCRSRNTGALHQLSRSTVDGYALTLKREKKSPKTIHNAISTIRAALNAAEAAGVIDVCPIKNWLLPDVPDSEIYPLTPEQLRRVLEIVREREPVIYNVTRWIAFTGNRPSDARGLKWCQVDLETRTVERPQVKTKRLAQYQIGDDALAALLDEKRRGRPGPSGEVFTDDTGHPFQRNYILRAFSRACRRSEFGRPVNLKDLRHTFAHLIINFAGCPLPVAQQLMGHGKIEMTMRYCRPASAAPHLDRLGVLVRKGTTENDTE